MLISVQYQVSLFHKPYGRLTSCISPDGLPHQPLTSMAPYLHDKSWNALLQCFYLGRMSQLMAWRLIIAHFIPQDWNRIWLPLGAKLFWSTEKLSRFQLCTPTTLLSSHLSIISLLLHPSSPLLVYSFIIYTLYKSFLPLFLLVLTYNHWGIHINTSEKNYTHQKRTEFCVGDNIFLTLIGSLIISCNKKCNCLCQLFSRITTYLKVIACEESLKSFLPSVFINIWEALEKSQRTGAWKGLLIFFFSLGSKSDLNIFSYSFSLLLPSEPLSYILPIIPAILCLRTKYAFTNMTGRISPGPWASFFEYTGL